MKSGAIMANSGHFNVEINIPELEKLSVEVRRVPSSSMNTSWPMAAASTWPAKAAWSTWPPPRAIPARSWT